MIKVSFGCYLTFVMNSCSQSMIFGNVSQHLEIRYVGQTNGCKARIKEDIAKLNAVAEALKASSVKALTDFQRRQFGTPPTLFGTHATGFSIVLGRIIAQLLN